MSLDFDLFIEVDTGGKLPKSIHLFGANITHNVSNMWAHAGCFHALYESQYKKAGEIILNLEASLKRMKENPEFYIARNPKNGWGNYNTALDFLQKVHDACVNHPKAEIWISK